MRCLFLLILFVNGVTGLFAQAPDSVTVTGRIENLSVRLYRQSPAVSVSRSNILQPDEELVRPGDIQPDGRFRLTLPLLFPYEEMEFRFGNVRTTFLAAPGTVEIRLNADSLYAAEVPFRFGGTLAEVNQELARYKAYEFKNRRKTDPRKLAERVNRPPASNIPSVLMSEFMSTFDAYQRNRQVPPLLTEYQTSLARSEGAIYLYEKFLAENLSMVKGISEELMPPNDPFLTVSKAIAYDRMATYYESRVAQQTVGQGGRSVPAPLLAGLLLRYGKRIEETERSRLAEIVEKNAAQSRDMSLLNRVLNRNADTLSDIVSYESYRAQIKSAVDSTRNAYLMGRVLARSFPELSLKDIQTLYTHAAPQMSVPVVRQSLEEIYRLQAKDSASIRQVVQTMASQTSADNAYEVLPGVFVLQNWRSGKDILDEIRRMARGRLAYIITYTNAEPGTRLAALQARQLATEFSARDLLVVYLCADGGERDLWQEWVGRNRPPGLNVFSESNQAVGILTSLRAFEFPGATLMGRDGKFIKRGAPLPDKMDEVIRLIRGNL
ncbi:hypothetical protein [Tellurirhabdus rosea]|uniref:hypothetical protein n=1 Tax=Tellurirhabdus rosea TaxID=2674997 RepID=UPI0022517123|nr:hypothetical protein [Tellurirhabdus rosea]